MNRESDIWMSEIYQYLGLNNVKKHVILCAIATPLLFGFVFLALARGGPTNHFQSPSIEIRIFGSSVITAGFLMCWLGLTIRSIHLRNFIKKQWSTKEEQEKLIDNYIESVSVFQGKVKIGKDYTFTAMAGIIIETRQILSLYSKRDISGRISTTTIYATVERLQKPSRHISLFSCSDNKKGRAEADNLIREATDVLKTMKK